MPLPFLFTAIGAYGAKKAYDGYVNKKEAKYINEQAQDLYDNAYERYEKVKVKYDKALKDISKKRVHVSSVTLHEVLRVLKQIKSNKDAKTIIKEIEAFNLDLQDSFELIKNEIKHSDVLVNSIGLIFMGLPMLTTAGFLYAKKGQEALDNAKSNLSNSKILAEELDTHAVVAKGCIRIINNIVKLVNELEELLLEMTKKLESQIKAKNIEKEFLGCVVQLARLIKGLFECSIFDENNEATKEIKNTLKDTKTKIEELKLIKEKYEYDKEPKGFGHIYENQQIGKLNAEFAYKDNQNDVIFLKNNL